MREFELQVHDDIIEVVHLGLTLRTLLGAAAKQNLLKGTKRRKWRLSYSGVIIGHVRVANNRDEYEDVSTS